MSRSSAIALAIFSDWLGADREYEAVKELMKEVPLRTPNGLVVEIAHRLLGRRNRLVGPSEKHFKAPRQR